MERKCLRLDRYMTVIELSPYTTNYDEYARQKLRYSSFNALRYGSAGDETNRPTRSSDKPGEIEDLGPRSNDPTLTTYLQ